MTSTDERPSRVPVLDRRLPQLVALRAIAGVAFFVALMFGMGGLLVDVYGPDELAIRTGLLTWAGVCVLTGIVSVIGAVVLAGVLEVGRRVAATLDAEKLSEARYSLRR